ncbi:major facilitator superfamily domain-containing protein [Phyllosticta citriasiana]|uniref:Major facilitator superfamily domain-containing protein n=1 Tax=Phyllosticta citriasiana TaxID=595635 RepID=A0ABR1KEI0_9PEZI
MTSHDVQEQVESTEDARQQQQQQQQTGARLLKKIDRFLLPLMWFCYGIQQTDKTAVSTQALFGLREDTHLVGQQCSWLTTIFYLAYVCGEFPSNILPHRWALGRTLSIYMLCWGICVICIAAAQNWTHLMVLRGLQGFFECTISPGFVLVISSWYRTEEHATPSERYGGLAAWRAISLFLGAATLLSSVTSFALLASPKEVRWMNNDEKRMARPVCQEQLKVGRDVTGVKWSWPQVAEAFKDPQLYFCCVNAFLSSVPNGGLSTFGSLMNQSFGFTKLQVLLMDIARSVVSVLVFLAVSIYTRRVANRRMYIMALGTLPPFAGMLAMALLSNTSEYKWIKWGAFSSNVAGRTKKTIISSATFIGYCTGNMCGSQIFREADGPRYIPGTIGCSACFGLEFFLICAWRAWYVCGRTADDMEREGRELGERDVTDLRNPHFRYAM